MPSNRVRINFRLWVKPTPPPPPIPKPSGLSRRGTDFISYATIGGLALILVLITVLAFRSFGNNGNPKGAVVSSSNNSTPNAGVISGVNPSQTPALYPTIVQTLPPTATKTPSIPTSTWTPLPPTSTPVPTTGALRIELRHVDGSPILNTKAELFLQAADINGDPMLGQSVGSSTSGSSGAAVFDVAPGQYVVLLSLGGIHLRPDVDRPGLANLAITAGETTQVSVKMGLVISSLRGATESCLIVENPDGSAYNASCKGFSDGLSRVETLPGNYHLSFTFGDLVRGYSDVGPITVSVGQTIEKHCTATAAPFQKATCD